MNRPFKNAPAFGPLLKRFAPLLALILLITGTALVEVLRVPPGERAFLTAQNLSNIIGQWSFKGIVAVGMTFVIILGGIDLSVGSMVALTAGAGVYALNAVAPRGEGMAVCIAAGVCILGGVVLGVANGLVISVGRVAPFVATLGTLAAYRSLILAPAEGSEIRAHVPAFSRFGGITVPIPGLGRDGHAVELKLAVIVFAVATAIGYVLLARTVFGRRVYAIGGNARAARYAGVKIAPITIAVYGLSGLTCGISALLSASRMNSVASSSLGLFYELDAIAAVVIGGTSLRGGSGSIFGTVVGVLILAVVQNMLNILGVPAFYHDCVKGVIIIAAVLLQRGPNPE